MADEFDPMAIPGRRGKMAAAGDEDMPVTITMPGEAPIETTTGQIRAAAEKASNGIARDQLRAFIERIERLEEEKATIVGDIKDVYGEAKGTGFDTKALRKIVAIRKKGEEKWREEESILDTYLAALGMLGEGGEA